jgi:DNA-binding winged helix-turn-helix (wHTH) protein
MDAATNEGVYYGFGPFVLDPTRRALTHDGEAVALFPTALETLIYLVEHPGRVVSRGELMDAIWPRRVVEDANISQTIFTLRKALASADSRLTYIATQPGQGYRFVQPVKKLTASPSPPGPPATAAGGPGRMRALIAPYRALTAVGLVVLTCAGLGAWLVPSPYLTVLTETKVQSTLALMTRSREDRLVPAIAQEVCARNNGLAAVSGSVAKVGTKYLLTLTATDCSSGDTLDAEKAEIVGRDGLLSALDGMVGTLRRRLGESAESVRRFAIPLVRVRTASLEALKSYSDGEFQFNHGRRTEAIPLFQRAVELDPKFATAYGALSVVYANLRENDLAAVNATRAYALRDSVDERERFFISYRYNTFVTQDVPEACGSLKAGLRSTRRTRRPGPTSPTRKTGSDNMRRPSQTAAALSRSSPTSRQPMWSWPAPRCMRDSGTWRSGPARPPSPIRSTATTCMACSTNSPSPAMTPPRLSVRCSGRRESPASAPC